MNFKARVWIVGDNINTDLILPNKAFYLTHEEQAMYVFSANRPGWAEQVKKGDILIGGRNFGMGSSRAAARSLKNLGLSCLLAESLNGLFLRNCVNFAFPALECPGVHAAFSEGEEAEVDFENARVRNITRKQSLTGKPLPASLMALVQAGGVYPLLEREGLIASRKN
ncbi:MAG: 3-isopropylmalate dehydratase [Betaproteobacteria bacterium]|jgi:3-isopropylmalate/(R)-2-methylmalate dehydratase small subunit|nr:3-isopropylmalate dehydratase [Betaproteobacteria bacterium]MDH4294043.1 3-isopropylmalate dehydratase [Betaproteobacteria bacterium]MDH5342167.1 3-isopropylmalate dehydratase [Betaproteobacteria bacterium]